MCVCTLKSYHTRHDIVSLINLVFTYNKLNYLHTDIYCTNSPIDVLKKLCLNYVAVLINDYSTLNDIQTCPITVLEFHSNSNTENMCYNKRLCTSWHLRV